MAHRWNTGFVRSLCSSLTVILAVFCLQSCGGSSGGSGGSGGGGGTPPSAPTGLMATAGAQQVSLSWTASAGATGYNVERSTTTGGPYTKVASPTATSYVDTGVTAGTTYYYVVAAVNASGTSGLSAQVSATPSGLTSVSVSVNVLANRHAISPYVYGGAFPQDAPTITDSGLPVVRWGGNAASTYNWQLGTDNADNDYYFEDYNFGALNNPADSISTQFISDVQKAGSNPLMTMVMLPWVAQTPEVSTQQGTGGDNFHWVFSVSQDGACSKPGVINPNTGAFYNNILDDSTLAPEVQNFWSTVNSQVTANGGD